MGMVVGLENLLGEANCCAESEPAACFLSKVVHDLCTRGRYPSRLWIRLRIFSLAPSLITFMLVEHPVFWGLLLGPSPPRRLAAQVGSTRTRATCLRQHSKSVTARGAAQANLPCGVPTHACTHTQLHAVSDLARVPRVTRSRSCNSIVLRLPHRARACSSARAHAVCSGHAQRSARRPAAKHSRPVAV